MNNFFKGILSIGVLFPQIVSSQKIQNPWTATANDFFESGKEIQTAINEQQELYSEN